MVEIIAEVGNAHDGSLGLAHAHINAARNAGADTIKFQCHIADAESTATEPWRVKPQWSQDASRYDYWKRLEFTEPQWAELRRHALALGLRFLCSPFSIAAFELLQRIGVDRWKVASGEVTNKPLLFRIAATKQPVFISTGLATFDELDDALSLFEDYTVMNCISVYPTPPELIEINDIGFNGKFGYSDHSGTIFPSLLAAWIDASAVEGVRFIERMGKEPYEPDPDMRRIFMTRDEHGRKTG